jgi:Protein of unknown function (DUF3662)/FHA domain
MLERFERLVEQAVEGSLRRVFPTTLQPVQLARAAARAMEHGQVVGLRGAEVPNLYRLRLAPADLERFADYSATLARQLEGYLVDYARERDLHPVGPPRVELVGDERVRVGTVRAEARFVDAEPASQARLDAAVEGTRQLRLQQLHAAPMATSAPSPRMLWLTDRLGAQARLDPDALVVRIGRASDNDLSIANQRVSRYHAQVRWVAEGWLVYDLDSTNGTFVDDQPVTGANPRRLGPGSVLRLGDHELRAETSVPEPAASSTDEPA